MQEIDFGDVSDSVQHQCEATREEDWVVFRCPQCPDYERRLNWRTGAMQVRNVKADIRHSGAYTPPELSSGSTQLH